MNTHPKSIFFCFSLFISTMLLASIPSQAQAQTAPIQIKTCQDLQNINNNLSGNYVLAHDIDCSGFAFVPIGSAAYPYPNPFTGFLSGLSSDGQTIYKIKNLTITQSTGSAALFGSIGGISAQQLASVHDLSLTNLNIQSNNDAFYVDDVAGLAIQTMGNSFIRNITINEKVRGLTTNAIFEGAISHVGGRIGNLIATNDIVENVSVNLNSQGVPGIYGFTGTNFGIIRQSSVHLVVNALNVAAGFVNGNYGTINDSYVTGVIIAATTNSGFALNNYGSISNSYAAVYLSPVSSTSSGFLGNQFPGGITTHCYWDKQLSGVNVSAAGTGESTANMFQNSTFTGWDFTNSWNQYPHLRPASHTVIKTPIVTPGSQTVLTGATVTFTASEAGTLPITYQWQKNGINITGAIASSLTISSAKTSDTGSYTVIASNGAGSLTSNAATLTVNVPVGTLAIQNIGVDVSSYLNSANSLFAIATMKIQATDTQSQINIATAVLGSTGSNNVNVSFIKTIGNAYVGSGNLGFVSVGQTWSVLSITLTDAAGQSSTFTNGKDFNANFIIPALPSSPSITTQPASQTVNSGSPVTFSVVANSTTPLTYQWQKNNINITGAINATYTIHSVAAADAGSYTVVVGNAGGTVTSNAAILTVNAPPSGVSPDGSVLSPSSGGSLKTAAGTWTIGNGSIVFLNGNAVTVSPVNLLLVYNNGQVYIQYQNGGWYQYSTGINHWSLISGDPRVGPAFTNMIGVSVNGTTITKTAITGWGNAGAISIKPITTNGSVQFQSSTVPGNSNSNVMAGFITAGSYFANTYTGFSYSIVLKYNQQEIYEGPNSVFVLKGNYNATDVFSVVRSGSSINYQKNGVTFYTSSTPASGSLVAAAAIYDNGGTVTHIAVSGT